MRESGLTSAQIGEALGISTVAAGKLFRRARAWSQGSKRPTASATSAGHNGRGVDAGRLMAAINAINDRLSAIEEHLHGLVPQQKEESQGGSSNGASGSGPTNGGREPPRSLWTWLINEAVSELGQKTVAEWLGVAVYNVHRYQNGATPSARIRERIKMLSSTLWARDLFDDQDELEDYRNRLLTMQARSE